MRNRYAAFCFDSAVVHFGLIVEGAVNEMINVGSDREPKREAKYSLADLLTPGFRIGRDRGSGGGDELTDDMLFGLAGNSPGVRFDEVR